MAKKEEKNIKEFELKIEGEKWEKAIDAAYKEASKKAKIDGFRPGKAPKELFLKKYGEQNLYMDAADHCLQEAYIELLGQHQDLEIIAEPDIALKNIGKEGVTFTVTFTLRPEVTLGKYKGLGVKQEKVEAKKEEIEQVLEEMRNRYAENVEKDGKVEDGDIAVIDFEGFKDGVAFDGGKGENYSLTIGSHSFIPGFEEQIIGMKKDEEKEIKVTFPSDYHAEDLKGKEAVFKVKVNEIKQVVLPDYNEEFFADLGMDDVHSKKELEAKVKEDILAHKKGEAENKFIDALLEAASKNTKVEIPHAMIHTELDHMLHQYEQNLSMQGLTLQQFYQFTNTTEEQLKSQLHGEAEKRILIRLTLEEIKKAENIVVSEEEALKETETLSKQYQMKKEDFLKAVGGIEMIKFDLEMHRTIDFLKENNETK